MAVGHDIPVVVAGSRFDRRFPATSCGTSEGRCKLWATGLGVRLHVDHFATVFHTSPCLPDLVLFGLEDCPYLFNLVVCLGALLQHWVLSNVLHIYERHTSLIIINLVLFLRVNLNLFLWYVDVTVPPHIRRALKMRISPVDPCFIVSSWPFAPRNRNFPSHQSVARW
jgi:hypothetical protein